MTNLPIYTSWLAAFLVVFQVLLMFLVGIKRAKGLAGSHGDGEGGTKNPFILMRGFGARGTILVAFSCAGFLVANLI